MPARASDQAVVLYDGQCPLCTKTVSILKRFDWLRRLQFHDCRDIAGIPVSSAHLDPARMIQEMHVLTPDRTRVLSGYRAIRWIAGRVPLLWPIYPLLFIPGIPRIGQRLYLWIAKNRFNLLPCREGVCTIPPKRN
jgi:predicted DCC family thiol-disulfide oxidoreductase YuxK